MFKTLISIINEITIGFNDTKKIRVFSFLIILSGKPVYIYKNYNKNITFQ